jgi:cyclopropane fatty-acyl-phospholipid synthase-like methyltransferase
MAVKTLQMSDGASRRARNHYDTLDRFYRFFWGQHLHHGLFRDLSVSPREAPLALLDYFASLIEVPAGCAVLDVGCGYGATMFYLAERYQCRCTGLTISPAQYAYGQRQATVRGLDEFITIENCDAEVYDFGAVRYDLVLVIEASEHFAHRGQFFRNVAIRCGREGHYCSRVGRRLRTRPNCGSSRTYARARSSSPLTSIRARS